MNRGRGLRRLEFADEKVVDTSFVLHTQLGEGKALNDGGKGGERKAKEDSE